jgi:hypothetical protein
MSLLDRTALAVLGGVLAYVAFQWGGVVRTGRYEYLLLLGLLLDDAQRTWNWVARRGYADDSTAGEYAGFLVRSSGRNQPKS